MPISLPKDRVKQLTYGTGTGTIDLEPSVPTTYVSFLSAYGAGAQAYYGIAGTGTHPEWEIGLGELSSAGTKTKLKRTAGNVLAGSSGAGQLVFFNPGPKYAFGPAGPAARLAMRAGPFNSTAIPYADSNGFLADASGWFSWDNDNKRLTAGSLRLNHGMGNGQMFEVLTLSELLMVTTSAFTDTTIQIPANAVVFGVSVRITTQPSGTSTFDIGVSGATTRYGTGLSTAAGATNPGTNDATRFYSAATAIRFTPNVAPSAAGGRARITIYYYAITPPTS